MKLGSAKVGDNIYWIADRGRKHTCVITRIEDDINDGRKLWGYWFNGEGKQDECESWLAEETATLERISWKDRI